MTRSERRDHAFHVALLRKLDAPWATIEAGDGDVVARVRVTGESGWRDLTPELIPLGVQRALEIPYKTRLDIDAQLRYGIPQRNLHYVKPAAVGVIVQFALFGEIVFNED